MADKLVGIQLGFLTEAEAAASSFIPRQGELFWVRMLNGQMRAYVGDTTHTIAQLFNDPATDYLVSWQSAQASLLGGMTFSQDGNFFIITDSNSQVIGKIPLTT